MAHYWKRDSEKGFIEDTAYIKYEKFNNLRHSVIGFMMGDFDHEGNYVVSPQIKRELIEMPKYIVESMDNIEICRSEIKLNRHISFMVAFEGNRATLSLLEKINYEANYKLNSGSYSNINEYLLDQVETSGVINRNAIYQRWNIVPMGSHEVDIFNCDEAVLEKYFGIVRRFKYLMVSNTKLLKKEEELEEIESAYSNKMLEILKAYPALNNAVLAEIKETFKEKKHFVCADQPNFAKTLNEIIDTAIEQNLDVLEEEKQQAFKVEQRNLIVETNIKKEEVLDIQEKVQPLSEEDKKFNKKHDAENENVVPVVEVVVPETELNKPIEVVATEFAKTQKVVTEEIKEKTIAERVEEALNKDNNNISEKTEREILIETIDNVVGEDVSILTADAEEKIEKIVTGENVVDNNTDKKEEVVVENEVVAEESDKKLNADENSKLINKTAEENSKKRDGVSWAGDQKPFEFKYETPQVETPVGGDGPQDSKETGKEEGFSYDDYYSDYDSVSGENLGAGETPIVVTPSGESDGHVDENADKISGASSIVTEGEDAVVHFGGDERVGIEDSNEGDKDALIDFGKNDASLGA